MELLGIVLGIEKRRKKRGTHKISESPLISLAGPTRLELATSGVTGRRSNQTELRPQSMLVGGTGLEPVTPSLSNCLQHHAETPEGCLLVSLYNNWRLLQVVANRLTLTRMFRVFDRAIG